MKNLNAANLEYVKTVMKELGLSATALAKKAGIAPTTLTRALNDPGHKFSLSTTTLEKIQAVSNINADRYAEARDFADLSLSPYTKPDFFKKGYDEWPEDDPRNEMNLTLVIGLARVGVWIERSIMDDYPPALPFKNSFHHGNDCFCLKIGDDAIDKVAKSGAVAFCVIKSERTQIEYRHGDFVAVERRPPSGDLMELTIRQLHFADGAWTLRFSSSSNRYGNELRLDEEASGESTRLMGKVLAFINETPSNSENALMQY